MQLLKLIRLSWRFYRNFFLLSVVVTALCAKIFWVNGFAGFFGIFWCKVISLCLTYYLINERKKNEYYYYQNLGISKAILWSVTLEGEKKPPAVATAYC